MKDEALRMALEALEYDELPLTQENVDAWDAVRSKAITAIKQALETPVQEPMTWVGVDFAIDCSPLAQRQWVGLTDDDWQEIADDTNYIIWSDVKQAVNAKIKEKNNG
jgi:hypothetical protein